MFAHDFPFDPTYGYDLRQLLTVGAPAAPDDFAEFWRGMYARTRDISPRATKRQLPAEREGRVTFEVEFDSLDGFRVGGWLTLPVDGDVRTGLVAGHGYAGRDEPDYGFQYRHTAAIFPCGRGFNRSARPELPGSAAFHVIHGIASRQTYLHGKCVADFWAAVSALKELVPGDYPIDYAGGSFGGGLGAMALPWEPRFRRAFLEVPSFGNHPLRLTTQCTGSGEAVRQYYQRRPEVVDVLKYFDAATAATFTTIPTLVSAAPFDPAVPPPGQFAVYNSLAGTKNLFVREAGHFTYPNEAKDNLTVQEEIEKWFGK
jgi:cephalosporin-C deacetylase